PNGALVHIASGYGSSFNMTPITNATEAVATLGVGHGAVVGDFLEVTSGCSRLNNKIVRVDAVATNDVTPAGFNSRSTTVSPAGGGIGSVRKISGWTQLQQILESGSSGGEQQFLEYQLLEADAQVRIPTFKNAAGLTFSIADDATLAGYQLASTANDDRLPRAVRVTLPSASKLLYNAYISLDPTPSLTVNQVM